eukprot:3514304-Amphidinium_carterae.1
MSYAWVYHAYVLLRSSRSGKQQSVQDAMMRHVYPTAIFFADKLYSLSATTDDLCLLAECYFHNREHRPAIQDLS